VDKETIDNLAGNLAGKLADAIPEAVPSGAAGLKDDLERNFRGVLQAALAKMDLVTREEFDVQRKVLARTREKLEQLEKQLAELEQEMS